jgi:hypothetical protein
MKGKCLIIAIVVIVMVITVYKVLTFDIFDNELIFIQKLPVTRSDYSVVLYKFPSNATTEGSIQVHLILDSTGESKFYKNYDKYDAVTYARVANDTLLTIAIRRSTSDALDTLYISLPTNYNSYK